jgi:hypothetical protein
MKIHDKIKTAIDLLAETSKEMNSDFGCATCRKVKTESGEIDAYLVTVRCGSDKLFAVKCFIEQLEEDEEEDRE